MTGHAITRQIRLNNIEEVARIIHPDAFVNVDHIDDATPSTRAYLKERQPGRQSEARQKAKEILSYIRGLV